MSTTPQQQPQTPSPWPDKLLIRVVSGYETGVGLVTGALAMRDVAGCYRLEGGGLLCPSTGDVIETWEEMAAVPVHLLSELGEAFEGLDEDSPDRPEEGIDGHLIDAVRAVLACRTDA